MSQTPEWIKAVVRLGEELASFRAEEQRLEDHRSVIKASVVQRLMADGMAATPADKAASSDAEYLQHRSAQSDAVYNTQVAWAKYEAARLYALWAANTATPEANNAA